MSSKIENIYEKTLDRDRYFQPIRRVKDSWSRDEIIEIFNKMYATDIIDAYVKKIDFDKWIEENL